MVDKNKFWEEEPEENEVFSEKESEGHMKAALQYISTKSIIEGIVCAGLDSYHNYMGSANDEYFGDPQEMHRSIETLKLECSSSIEALMEMAIQRDETIDNMRKNKGIYPNAVDGRNVDEEKGSDKNEDRPQHIGLAGVVPKYSDCKTDLEKELWLQAEAILVYANTHIEYLECITILYFVLELCNNFDIDDHNKVFNEDDDESDDESDED